MTPAAPGALANVYGARMVRRVVVVFVALALLAVPASAEKLPRSSSDRQEPRLTALPAVTPDATDL